MKKALLLAAIARQREEIPIGAVVTLNNKLVGFGFNRCIESKDPTAHAEIQAIRKAAKTLANYRLVNCDLYVTVEPCLMCAGALIHARIRRLIFGTPSSKTGVINSLAQVLNQTWVNHQIEVIAGIKQAECAQIIQKFFKNKR